MTDLDDKEITVSRVGVVRLEPDGDGITFEGFEIILPSAPHSFMLHQFAERMLDAYMQDLLNKADGRFSGEALYCFETEALRRISSAENKYQAGLPAATRTTDGLNL